MEPTRIVLIRHGESIAQERQIVGGHAGCLGLSVRGRTEAAALRDRLLATEELMDAAGLYASVMARAMETAAIIAPAVGNRDVVHDCDFCEHHPGEADGLSWTEANRLFPPSERWDPDAHWVPGAESWAEMSERVRRGLDTVAQRHEGQKVVIVCHGGVVVHTMIRWLGLQPTVAYGGRARLDPVNTSITEWRLDPARAADRLGEVQLVRFNDHAHLAQPAVSRQQ
jgi:probable phosphoglycerate mutase